MKHLKHINENINNEITFYTISDTDYSGMYVTEENEIKDLVELYLYDNGIDYFKINKPKKNYSYYEISFVEILPNKQTRISSVIVNIHKPAYENIQKMRVKLKATDFNL